MGSYFTAVPGSSRWFGASYVTYSNDAKARTLLVPDAVLKEHGAVSEEVVRAMCTGLLTVEANADICCAISGVAGPSGGSSRIPVGSVAIACQYRGLETVSKMHRFEGDRQQVRLQSVVAALQGMIALIETHN